MVELSIIIPTCNRNDLLLRAIQSVISQNLDSYEIVVVDDSKEPRQPDFIATLAQLANIIYAVNTNDHGAANARNFGVNLARSEYVTFLDDDDIYLPGRLENMLKVMRSGDYVFVSSSRFEQVNNFSTIRKVTKQLQGVIKLKDIFLANDIDIGFMLKRSTFLNLNGFDSSFHNLEDWDFVIRMTKIGTGYKLPRLDYCVDAGNDRTRVSSNDWIGYSQILARYESSFGPSWGVFMQAIILRLRKEKNVLPYLSLSFNSRSIIPIWIWFKMILKNFISKYSS